MSLKPINRQIILKSRPLGMPIDANFALREQPTPKPKEGEVLVETLYLSVDPYMRGRMSDLPSYMPPFEVGAPIVGGSVGRVLESHNPKLKAGDLVLGFSEWADTFIASGVDLQKLDPHMAPISLALGALGMTGMTAYFGLLDIGKPQAGETVLVSGAAGAVGVIVGQIAKLKGCRVVGIAGGGEKVSYLTKELGFDEAIDYKKNHYEEALKRACPKGINIYFDNVGGDISDHVFNYLAREARIILCGQISQYNQEHLDIGPRPFVQFLVKAVMLKGMAVKNYQERFPEGIKQMAEWIKEGKIKLRENVIRGLENAPKAFLGLFKGENIGKQIVKVAD